jgi:hypothetical protein
VSLSDDQKGSGPDGGGKSRRSGLLDFLGEFSLHLLAPVWVGAMIALGILIYRVFPGIGYLGAGIVSLVVVTGSMLLIGRLFSRWRGLPSVEETNRRRADRQAAATSSDQPRSGLRQRLIDMGVRPKNDPPSRKET